MALVTDKFIYAHLPKTGGQFVRHVIDECGIEYREEESYHAAPSALVRNGFDLPILITIRHPVTWYQSRWHHRLRHGWSAHHPVDWACASNDFNQFVLNVIDYDPNGRFTSLVQLFHRRKKPGSTVDFVLKNETLTDELYHCLVGLGYTIDRDFYNNLRKINVSGKKGVSSADVAVYRPEVLEKLLEHEKWVIDTFYDGITDPNALTNQLVV